MYPLICAACQFVWSSSVFEMISCNEVNNAEKLKVQSQNLPFSSSTADASDNGCSKSSSGRFKVELHRTLRTLEPVNAINVRLDLPGTDCSGSRGRFGQYKGDLTSWIRVFVRPRGKYFCDLYGLTTRSSGLQNRPGGNGRALGRGRRPRRAT